MTHTMRHVVNLTVTSTNSTLLDDLEAELPDEDVAGVAEEYEGPIRRSGRPNLADGEERLSARVTFKDSKNESGDMTEGSAHADNLFTALKNYDLVDSSDYRLRMYVSPVKATTVEDVWEWYEEDPTRQPEDDTGEQYVPTSFDPANHIIKELSG